MGNSKEQILGTGDQLSPRTPGPWGHNDAGDPSGGRQAFGDTVGPTGNNDKGDPNAPAAGGLCTTPTPRKTLLDIPVLKNQRDQDYAHGGLVIRGSDDYISTVLNQLELIRATQCGAKLLAKLKALSADKRGKGKVMILSDNGGRNSEALYKPDAYPNKVKIEMWNDMAHSSKLCFPGSGRGSDVVVHHDETIRREENGQTIPAAIGLAHELVHAWHQAEGTLAAGWKDNVWNYERQSVGLGEYYKCGGGCTGNVTENCIRAQWTPKLKPRKAYGGEEKGVEPNL